MVITCRALVKSQGNNIWWLKIIDGPNTWGAKYIVKVLCMDFYSISISAGKGISWQDSVGKQTSCRKISNIVEPRGELIFITLEPRSFTMFIFFSWISCQDGFVSFFSAILALFFVMWKWASRSFWSYTGARGPEDKQIHMEKLRPLPEELHFCRPLAANEV